MTEPTDKQIEWAARLLCKAQGVNPDQLSEWPDFNFVWEHETPIACRLLAELERQGVKACTREDARCNLCKWKSGPREAFDELPICPEAD